MLLFPLRSRADWSRGWGRRLTVLDTCGESGELGVERGLLLALVVEVALGLLKSGGKFRRVDLASAS